MQQTSLSYCLNNHTIIQVFGSDASKFLQGQCTVDVVALKDDHATLAAICNEKGRVISLFHLLKDNEAFYLVLPTEIFDITWSILKKYAPFYKNCQIEQIKNRNIIFTDHTSTQTNTQFSWPSYGYFYFADPLSKSTSALNDEAWHIAMLRKASPRLHPSTSSKLLPQELGLTALDAVSFTKGCFTGQAIIARVHYRSDREYHRYLAEINSNRSPILSEWHRASSKHSLTIIDAAKLQDHHYLALCYSIHEWSPLDLPISNEWGECLTLTPLPLNSEGKV